MADVSASNYPAGVDNGHPHFWEPNPLDLCPECGEAVGDEVYCPHCDAPLDPEEAAAIEREIEEDRAYDLSRDMEQGA